ncbi:MAG: hypothetical protein WC356_04615 [Candidatus Micrarchaeia archaeon]|jgi:hypothetical protein
MYKCQHEPWCKVRDRFEALIDYKVKINKDGKHLSKPEFRDIVEVKCVNCGTVARWEI